MAESNSNEIMNNEQVLKELKKSGHFDISVCDNVPNIDDNPKFKKLELTTGQKMQMTALAGALPSVIGVNKLNELASKSASLYLVNCPWGIENTLRMMSNGNYANFIHDGLRFRGYAPISPVSSLPVSEMVSAQATMMAVFTAMSVVTSQYYLNQINNELSSISMGVDKILKFLYGDKKAELMSEIIFAKNAHENYASIMAHSDQRAATIASLQNAKKVAIKDAEFYISDISNSMHENSGLETIVEKVCSIDDSLELAIQLAVMSTIMETYYSQNFDKEYLEYLERSMSLYIDKCDKCRLGAFAKLHERIDAYKPLPPKKVDKSKLLQKIDDILKPLQNGDESPIKQTLREGLYSSSKPTSYYISKEGNVYIKTA